MAEVESEAPVPFPEAAEAEVPEEQVQSVAPAASPDAVEAEAPVESEAPPASPDSVEAEAPVESEAPPASSDAIEAEAPAKPDEVDAPLVSPEDTVESVDASPAAEGEEEEPAVSGLKRKHEVLEADEVAAEQAAAAGEEKTDPEDEVVEEVPVPESANGMDVSEDKGQEAVIQGVDLVDDDGVVSGAGIKRQKVDGEAEDSEKLVAENGQISSEMHNELKGTEKSQEPGAVLSSEDGIPLSEQQPTSDLTTSSRTIEVPNRKVGVLIGRSGDTIRYLQYSSGAKIQIMRDAEVDPDSSNRSVELIGSAESIDKAERLIKDVITESEAGGTPAVVPRGLGNAQSGLEQLEIRVPVGKVGSIIGRGGEQIKNLQTRSGARIQLTSPQGLPEADASTQRVVRISGNKKQIEIATEMIEEIMNQIPRRNSGLSGGYHQQAYRPRGPAGPPQWGSRAMPPSSLTPGYDYQQRGMYSSQTSHYPQAYGGYPQQPSSRGGYGASWDQRQPTQPQGGPYDYYGQGGPAVQQSGPLAPSAVAPTSAPVNYYGPGSGYGQTAPYNQSLPAQQGYGHGYNEPKYDAQAPNPQFYGQQQPISSQPGPYLQQSGPPQSGYQQLQYNKPPYAQGPPQSYGPPRAGQPGDSTYQGSVPSGFVSGGAPQQQYPYASSAPPSQPMPAAYAQQPYGGASGTSDGYVQQPAAGYAQVGSTTAGYAQAGQAAPLYQQAVQPAAYGQYPTSQPVYGEQPAQANAGYGYQGGPTDASYGSTAAPSGGGYSAPAPGSAPAGYVQPAAATGYEQTAPQAGYASYPGSAPVG